MGFLGVFFFNFRAVFLETNVKCQMCIAPAVVLAKIALAVPWFARKPIFVRCFRLCYHSRFKCRASFSYSVVMICCLDALSCLGLLQPQVGSGAQVVATDPSLISEDISKPKRGSAIQAWVNVIYGCNEHCTYCVVPGVRGVEQSRPKESIRKEIEELAAAGYREITLLGQNIDAYGRDMNPRTTFADLLHYVGDVPGIERMKFVTSHPRYMSERVVDAVATIPALSEVFYVPFQSGDDEVLRRMRRGYSVATYMRIIDRIKRLVPDAAICGDVIVGFPGETDDQFERTLDLIRNVCCVVPARQALCPPSAGLCFNFHLPTGRGGVRPNSAETLGWGNFFSKRQAIFSAFSTLKSV